MGVLSLGVRRGSQIKIGGKPIRNAEGVIVEVRGGKTLTVTKVVSEADMTVDVEGTKHRITNESRVELLPNVFVSAGKDPSQRPSSDNSPYTRLAFEAPKHININRVPYIKPQ